MFLLFRLSWMHFPSVNKHENWTMPLAAPRFSLWNHTVMFWFIFLLRLTKVEIWNVITLSDGFLLDIWSFRKMRSLSVLDGEAFKTIKLTNQLVGFDLLSFTHFCQIECGQLVSVKPQNLCLNHLSTVPIRDTQATNVTMNKISYFGIHFLIISFKIIFYFSMRVKKVLGIFDTS